MHKVVWLPWLFAAASAVADTCPWLDEKSAAEALLVPPGEVRVEKNPLPADPRGVVSHTTCRFRDTGDPLGQLAVAVWVFGSEAQASAGFDAALKGQSMPPRKAPVAGLPGFFAVTPGLSGNSWVRKGPRLVRVVHVYSRRVKDSIERDPDGAVISTHEIARRVVARLP